MSSRIFDESFEATWKDFDRAFRARLLKRIQELGSLYRLVADRDEAGRLIGERFYEALESTLVEGKYLDAFRRAVVGSLPATFSELVEVFKRHDAYPLHKPSRWHGSPSSTSCSIGTSARGSAIHSFGCKRTHSLPRRARN